MYRDTLLAIIIESTVQTYFDALQPQQKPSPVAPCIPALHSLLENLILTSFFRYAQDVNELINCS